MPAKKKDRLQIIVSILIVAIIAALAIVIFAAALTNRQHSQTKPATIKEDYTDIRLAMLVECQNCHIKKQPAPGCGNLTHRDWAACTDRFYGVGEAP